MRSAIRLVGVALVAFATIFASACARHAAPTYVLCRTGKYDPHTTIELASVQDAARLMTFDFRQPGNTLGAEVERVRVAYFSRGGSSGQAADASSESLAAQRPITVDYDGFTLAAFRDVDEAQAIADLEALWGGPRSGELSVTVAGRPARTSKRVAVRKGDIVFVSTPAVLTWVDGDVRYTLTGVAFDSDDLMRIARSMY